MLTDPDAFRRDPYGYVTNQAGHGYLVGVPLALLALPWFGQVAPVVVGVGYWLIWEIGVQRGRLWRDSLEDAVHVTTGAAVITAALEGGYWPVVGMLAALAALLAVGVWRRM